MTRHLDSRSGHHHEEPQEDYGGLHRDLRSTGAKMSRRNNLRMAASFGACASVLQLLGCGFTRDVTGVVRNDIRTSFGTWRTKLRPRKSRCPRRLVIWYTQRPDTVRVFPIFRRSLSPPTTYSVMDRRWNSRRAPGM